MIKIRQMKENDIDSVYNLGTKIPYFAVSTETIFYSREELRNWLMKKGDDVLLVAEEKGQIIGFIFGLLHKPTGNALIDNIAVEETYQRKGVGSKLLKRGLKILGGRGAKYFYALTRTTNKKALGFMLKHGFRKGYNFTWLEKV